MHTVSYKSFKILSVCVLLCIVYGKMMLAAGHEIELCSGHHFNIDFYTHFDYPDLKSETSAQKHLA